MWFFRRKKMRHLTHEKEQEVEQIKADTQKRAEDATKPIKRLTERFEQNGITLEIKRGLGSRHA